MGADLYLGQVVDAATGEPTDARLSYDADDLTTHGVIVGMTGSGKTGLAIVLLEELLARGIPALILDPKGDMANLLLNFPELRPADFEPWVNAGDARNAGVSVGEFAAQQADLWRGGLERAGIEPARLRELRDRVRWEVYTPGSSAGTPLNVLGDLRAPENPDDLEALREQASSYVSGLLALVGIESDPLSSREHILLSNLLEHEWTQGRSLDLAGLITLALTPPFRKLGVFDLDAFFPAEDRRALALKLNGLVASPTFSAWAGGAPLDIEALLGGASGATASIVYLAHLSESERQFVVSAVMSRVVSWMRSQPGTNNLRGVVYMDEVFGFLPPTAEPPSKRPLLTMLKQARAYGVGLVLSTQNPVDLDYKAMSNAGTWMIGRLQTERDKARVLEALSSASGEFDRAEVDRQLSSLGKRQFLLHNTHDRGGPGLFTTRWAMSYLRGPVTREQIALLPNRAASATAAPASPASPVAVAPAPAAPSTPAPTAAASTAAAPTDAAPVAPEVAPGVPVFFVDPAAPWARELGATVTARHEAAIVARVGIRFDERAMDLDHRQEWEAVFFPLTARLDPTTAIAVDYDARDLRDAAAVASPTFVPPDVLLGDRAYFTDLERDLKQHLLRSQQLTLFRNRVLRLVSRPDEDREAFIERCREAADERADQEASKLRDQFETKMDRVRDAIGRAEDRAEQLDVDAKSRRGSELVSTVGGLLGAFLGGKTSAKGVAGRLGRSAGSVMSRRGVTRRTEQRLSTARQDILEKQEDLQQLEADLRDDLADIVEEWESVAEDIEEVPVTLERDDVTVEELAVAWIPMERR